MMTITMTRAVCRLACARRLRQRQLLRLQRQSLRLPLLCQPPPPRLQLPQQYLLLLSLQQLLLLRRLPLPA